MAALFLGEMLTATAMGFFRKGGRESRGISVVYSAHHLERWDSGSQASTLVIRAMAVGEVTLDQRWRVIRREISAALVLGAFLVSVAFPGNTAVVLAHSAVDRGGNIP